MCPEVGVVVPILRDRTAGRGIVQQRPECVVVASGHLRDGVDHQTGEPLLLVAIHDAGLALVQGKAAIGDDLPDRPERPVRVEGIRRQRQIIAVSRVAPTVVLGQAGDS